MSFYYQAGIILHWNRQRVHYGAKYSDELGRVLWGPIHRRSGCRHGMRLRNSLHPERLYRILRWTACHEHDAGHDETIHDTVTWNQRYFAFIRLRNPLVHKYHVISLIQSCSAYSAPGSTERVPLRLLHKQALTVGQLLDS